MKNAAFLHLPPRMEFIQPAASSTVALPDVGDEGCAYAVDRFPPIPSGTATLSTLSFKTDAPGFLLRRTSN
jgi:hypothetical protein